MNTRILAIDDDIELLDMLHQVFVRDGYHFLSAKDGAEGLRALQNHSPHLVLLDVMLPKMDGWEVCWRIRDCSDVPIIMLTALGQEEELVRGLELGADDYMSKPFSVAELRARVRSVLRRRRYPLSGDLWGQIDERLAIDRAKCCAQVNGRLVSMSSLEYKLLDCFVQNADRLLTHQTLLSHVWGWEYVEETDYLKVYVHRLRKKIEPDPSNPVYIVTERGLGYRFQVP